MKDTVHLTTDQNRMEVRQETETFPLDRHNISDYKPTHGTLIEETETFEVPMTINEHNESGNIHFQMGQETEKCQVDSFDDNTSSDHGLTRGSNRGQWKRKAEYLLSVLGYMVGLGNIWRFPYICARNGGGAFLVPFIICLILIAFPVHFMELAIGQLTAKSVINCWGVCPLLKGIGVGMVIVNALLGIYYAMIIVWTLYYIVNSFISPLPWSTCGNYWNTNSCIIDTLVVLNETRANRTTFANSNVSSEEEFWERKALRLSDGIENMGDINIEMVVCLILTWVIIFLCLMKGVQSIGKVVYVTVTFPYVLLTVLFCRAVTLPGAVDGILYYITPDFSKMMSIQVWTEAAIQVFYSAGICYGPLITMSSFNKSKSDCFWDSVLLIGLGEGTSIFGGFVIFAVLGFMAQTNHKTIEDIVVSGPGLAYVVYPEAISLMPAPNLWAVLFFLMILTVGLDTEFGALEPVITSLHESITFFRERRLWLTMVVMLIGCVLGIPLCFQNGMYIFQLVDWYLAAFSIPVFGLLECLIFGWIYGAENFFLDIRSMTGMHVPRFVRILWRFVSPMMFIILLGITIFKYKFPTYGNYHYPPTANVFGLIFSILPILPIPVVAVLEIRKAPGRSFMEKFRNALKPEINWNTNCALADQN